jgi:hypothetical protein
MSEDSYLYQGRQQHGWLGHGTKPHDLDAPDAFESRIGGLLHLAAERLPASTRGHPALRTGARELAPLETAAAPWAVHDGLDHAAFRTTLLPAWVPGDAWLGCAGRRRARRTPGARPS